MEAAPGKFKGHSNRVSFFNVFILCYYYPMNTKKVPYTSSIIFAAEYISRLYKEYVRRIVKEHSLPISYEEYIILDTVYFYPGSIQMEIAKKICMQRSYLCKILSKLEDGGYITREEKIRGKRQVVIAIYITKKGEEIQKKMYSLVINTLMSKLNLDMDKMQQISKVLFDICDDGTKNFNIKL